MGLQYGTTLKTKRSGSSSFYYCDSLVNQGWFNACVGNDSSIQSNFTKTFNINRFGIYLLKHKTLQDGKLDIAGGASVNASFLSQREQRFDELLDYNKTEKALGLNVSALIRLSYFPNTKMNHFSIFLEGRSGMLISPQYR
jgi:hypothetical protein